MLRETVNEPSKEHYYVTCQDPLFQDMHRFLSVHSMPTHVVSIRKNSLSIMFIYYHSVAAWRSTQTYIYRTLISVYRVRVFVSVCTVTSCRWIINTIISRRATQIISANNGWRNQRANSTYVTPPDISGTSFKCRLNIQPTLSVTYQNNGKDATVILVMTHDNRVD